MKRKFSVSQQQNLTGWIFLASAVALLAIFLFYPMVKGLVMSLQGKDGFTLVNYQRILIDPTFLKTIQNTVLYVAVELLIMLPLAMIMAAVLQQKDLKFRGLFRVLLFVPCTMALMSYATVFKIMFGNTGLINSLLLKWNILDAPYPFLTTTTGARMVISICLIWRWSGYNMVFYCTGFANIEPAIYEAAEIDGASVVQRFFKITLPLLKPIILLTMITTVNGTLQILDEIKQLTNGGPANSTASISLYIYNTAFDGTPKFAYACALSFTLFLAIALLTTLQMKVGDKREEA
jgi:lactose/L-arabinose transport system permease protein